MSQHKCAAFKHALFLTIPWKNQYDADLGANLKHLYAINKCPITLEASEPKNKGPFMTLFIYIGLGSTDIFGNLRSDLIAMLNKKRKI